MEKYNARFSFCYRAWFDAIYRDKYYYLGDAELMAAAFLLDIALYHLGPVRQVYSDPATQFDFLPFDGKPGRVVAAFMALLQSPPRHARAPQARRRHLRRAQRAAGGCSSAVSCRTALPESCCCAAFCGGRCAEWRALFRTPKAGAPAPIEAPAGSAASA